MNLSRLALVALAALRLTRFITTDSLGEWMIVGRVKMWAWKSESLSRETDNAAAEYRVSNPVPSPPVRNGWRSKLVKGLDCPFCVGFWIGALVLLGEVATRLPALRWARPVWTFALGALGLNYVTGHISARADG